MYFVPAPEDYRGRDVAIVGGGDSAFDRALEGIDVMDKRSRDVRRLETQAVVATPARCG